MTKELVISAEQPIAAKKPAYEPPVMEPEPGVETTGNGAVGNLRSNFTTGALPVEIQVPLAGYRRGVTLFFEHGCKGKPILGDKRLLAACEDTALKSRTPTVASRQKRVARRRANRGCGMSVGEGHSGSDELVQVRRRHLSPLRVQAVDFSVAHVVRKEYDDVGLLWFRCGR